MDLVSARSSLFDVAASIAEEENTVAPAFARACVDDLSKLAAARLSLTSALGDGGSHYEGEAGRVAAAVAATLGDWRVETEEMPDEPFLIALRPDRIRPGRVASHRGRLLRSDAWFDAAGPRAQRPPL